MNKGGIIIAVIVGMIGIVVMCSSAISVYGQLDLLPKSPDSEPDPTTHNEVWCELVQGGHWFTLDGEGHCLTN
jgi:hypothetical protein